MHRRWQCTAGGAQDSDDDDDGNDDNGGGADNYDDDDDDDDGENDDDEDGDAEFAQFISTVSGALVVRWFSDPTVPSSPSVHL